MPELEIVSKVKDELWMMFLINVYKHLPSMLVRLCLCSVSMMLDPVIFRVSTLVTTEEMNHVLDVKCDSEVT